MKAKKKRNATDATLRNIRALKKKVEALDRVVGDHRVELILLWRRVRPMWEQCNEKGKRK